MNNFFSKIKVLIVLFIKDKIGAGAPIFIYFDTMENKEKIVSL